jgi:hypothetical protein
MFDLLLSRPWPTIPARAACVYITPRPPTNPALPNVLTPVRSRQTFQAQATPHTITYQNGHVWFHDHDTSDLAFRQAIDAPDHSDPCCWLYRELTCPEAKALPWYPSPLLPAPIRTSLLRANAYRVWRFSLAWGDAPARVVLRVTDRPDDPAIRIYTVCGDPLRLLRRSCREWANYEAPACQCPHCTQWRLDHRAACNGIPPYPERGTPDEINARVRTLRALAPARFTPEEAP